MLRTWDMDLSLVSIHGFGSVISVPFNCRSHLFVWNVVCAGMIHVLVPPILFSEFVLMFVRSLDFFFMLWQRLCLWL